MASSTGARGRRRLVATAAAVLAGFVTLGTVQAEAHAPHDSIFDIAVSPAFADDGTVMTISRSELLRSVDGGATWNALANGIDATSQPRVVEISPAAARIVFVGTDGDGIFESADGGDSFARATGPVEAARIRVVVASPHDAELATALDVDGRVLERTAGGWRDAADTATAVAFGWSDPSVRIRGDATGRVETSDDAGTTWTTSRLDGPITAVADIGEGVVLAAVDGGEIQRSTDGGASFTPWHRLDPADRVVAMHRIDDAVWVVGADRGPVRHDLTRGHWHEPGAGLTVDPQADEPAYADQPHFGALAGGDAGAPLYLAGFDGLFRSTDAGARWTELDTLATTIVGFDLSPVFARSPTILVTTYVDGAHRSTDGGATWERIADDLELSERFTRLFDVVMSPAFADDETAFTSTIDGLLRTTDGGTTWAFTDTDAVEDDPVRNRIDVIRVSPAFADDGHVFIATVAGGLLASEDGGTSFERRAQFDAWPNALVLSPAFAIDGTMFIGTRRGPDGADDDAIGVWRSEDRGQSWERTTLTTGIRLLAISPAFDRDDTLFAASDRAVHVSTDGGATWRPGDIPDLRGARIEALAVSPDFTSDRTVLAAARGHGLLRSVDGGRTFARFAPEVIGNNYEVADFTKPTADPITFSPTYALDGTIVASAGSDLVITRDRGETWSVLPRPGSGADIAPRRLAEPIPADADSTGPTAAIGVVVAAGGVLLLAALAFERRRRRAPDGGPLRGDHGTTDSLPGDPGV